VEICNLAVLLLLYSCKGEGGVWGWLAYKIQLRMKWIFAAAILNLWYAGSYKSLLKPILSNLTGFKISNLACWRWRKLYNPKSFQLLNLSLCVISNCILLFKKIDFFYFWFNFGTFFDLGDMSVSKVYLQLHLYEPIWIICIWLRTEFTNPL
jgi:hypothetical protein